MLSLLTRISSFLRIIGIFLTIVLSAVLSIPSMIIDPSGYVSFLFLKMGGKMILFFSGARVRFKGLENIDRNKAQVFAANHASYLDIPVIYSAVPVKISWLAKKELFRIPFLGWLMKANRFISIDRGKGRKAVQSLNAAVEKVRRGTRIVIFPEGTRSADGELKPFKKLLFRLCIKTGVPVVPVYIKGAYDILKPGTLIFRPGNVYARIGREIETSAYQPNKIAELMNDLRESMINLKQDILND